MRFDPGLGPAFEQGPPLSTLNLTVAFGVVSTPDSAEWPRSSPCPCTCAPIAADTDCPAGTFFRLPCPRSLSFSTTTVLGSTLLLLLAVPAAPLPSDVSEPPELFFQLPLPPPFCFDAAGAARWIWCTATATVACFPLPPAVVLSEFWAYLLTVSTAAMSICDSSCSSRATGTSSKSSS